MTGGGTAAGVIAVAPLAVTLERAGWGRRTARNGADGRREWHQGEQETLASQGSGARGGSATGDATGDEANCQHLPPLRSYRQPLLEGTDMDAVFGRKNFINEIVWCYKSGGASPSRSFSRKQAAGALS